MAASLAAIGCFIDLFSKSWVFNWLGPPTTGRIHWLLPNHIGLQTSLNTGALFGMGQGGVGVLAIISLLAAIGVFVWLTWGGASHDRFISFVLGLITGGILGNMYDRMGLWGTQAVRDWILFQYNEQYVWPNFNIADSLLVVGAGLMMWHAFRQDAIEKRNAEA